MNTDHSCQWLLLVPDPSNSEYELEVDCGKPATKQVTVKSKVTYALVWLCDEHKKEHDQAFVNLRIQRKHKNTPK